MIVGYGDLAKKVANMLICSSSVSAVIICGRDTEKTHRDANLLRFTALNHGWDGSISARAADLEQEGQLATAIEDLRPDVVVNTASVQSWRRLTEVPAEIFAELDEAQFGPWLPMHLAPALSVMKEVRSVSDGIVVVNAAFPDAVGPALLAHGLAPDLGAGNVANVVPALTAASGAVLGLPADDVEVRLAAQHYYSHRLPRSGDAGEGDFAMDVRHRGRPVDIRPVMGRIQREVSSTQRRTGGVDGQALTASSVVKVLRALASARPRLVHAPSPNGLPGGYPVMLSRHGMTLSLPDSVGLDEAVRINVRGQWADGIEHTDESTGITTLRSENVAVLQKWFPVDDSPVDPDPQFASDLWRRAHRLRADFAEFHASVGAGR